MNFDTIKNRLSKYTVGIAGAGGLGSNCAASLVRVGIGRLIIVDFDVVDETNLNRQFYFRDQIGKLKVEALKENLQNIDPGIQVESHNLKIDEDNIEALFTGTDIIVEAFDIAEMKKMLIEKVLDIFPDKYLVVGIGMAGYGQSNLIGVEDYEKLIICGDQKNEISENNPPLGPRVGIVANMQANEVINILLNKQLDEYHIK